MTKPDAIAEQIPSVEADLNVCCARLTALLMSTMIRNRGIASLWIVKLNEIQSHLLPITYEDLHRTQGEKLIFLDTGPVINSLDLGKGLPEQAE